MGAGRFGTRTLGSRQSAIGTRVGVIAGLLMLVACSRTPPPSLSAAVSAIPENVLVVTIDTLRADRLGIYGAANVATPVIDRLAREGAWAPQADAQSPLTRPSHVSIFSGWYPD